MRKEFKEFVFVCLAAVVMVLSVGVVYAGDKSIEKDAKSVAVQLPDNIDELSAMESKLLAESKVVSDELFKTLTNMRAERVKIIKNDPDIKALNAKITELRAKVEKLTLKKSKDMSQWAVKREELANRHNDLRKELLAVKAKKAELVKAVNNE